MQFQILIDGKDTAAALPVKWNELLDERLDEGRLSLRTVPTKLYRIGASVSIKVNDTQRDFIISADESTEMPCGSGYYNHELSLIEPTKILEGIVVESLTFTNVLERNYTDAALQVSPTYEHYYGYETFKGVPSTYKSPLEAEKPFNVESFTTLFGGIQKKEGFRIYMNGTEVFTTQDKNQSISILPTLGELKIDYINFSVDEMIMMTFQFAVVNNIDMLPKWNIRSVIDRVLNLSEPHLQGVTSRYKLDPAQAAEFEQILAPEFAFTKCTLKEILDQIGGFIHGIPRLIRGESGKLDTIHYDMLGDIKEALISSKNTPYITEIRSQNIEDYATEIDSTVDNLVNTLDSGEGAIVEPYANGFKSVRSEEAYARIEEGNMVISTTLPIYSVQKLEVIDTKGNTGDITPYLFEGADYGRLSSFEGGYPTSKAYAIYYNLGEKNIKGLGYKSPNVLGGAFAQYTITNIIKAVTGDNIKADWWWNDDDDIGNYPRLAFRITYTPIFSARILQHKPYVEPNALKRSLVYNQGANLVETRYYGENMKGVIARMGNPELTRSYRASDLSLVPKIGEIFKDGDDKYFISSVTVEVDAVRVVFTVGMSKDFNRLSQYIGINSEWRAYEVSERKAYNRDIVYRDFCVIGDPIQSDSKALSGGGGMFYIANTFAQSTQGDYEEYSKPLTLAKVVTYDKQGKARPVTLPIVSTAFGNTLSFFFGMADNYSAGAKSVQQNNNYNQIQGCWQTDVPYVDYYGRVKDMDFYLAAEGKILGFNDPATFALPQGDEYGQTSAPIMTGNLGRLVVDKNGSEVLRMNYLIEFVSNRKDIIIGAAMTRNCLMVTTPKPNAVNAAALYVINSEIGQFDSKINLSEATLLRDYKNNAPYPVDGIIQLGIETSIVAGKAWAIADQSTGEILLAKNIDIAANDTISLPNITLTHELPTT